MKLLLAALLFIGQMAWATEPIRGCAAALVGSWEKLLKMGVDDQLIGADHLKRMLESPRPLDPIAGETETAGNVNYFKAISRRIRQTSLADWQHVQDAAQTQLRLLQSDAQAQLTARDATVEILNPKLKFNFDFGKTTDFTQEFYPVDTPDGRHLLIFFTMATMHVVEEGKHTSYDISHTFIGKSDFTILSNEELVITGAVGNGKTGMAVIGFNFKSMQVTKTYQSYSFDEVNGNSDLHPMWLLQPSGKPHILTVHRGHFSPFTNDVPKGEGVYGKHRSRFTTKSGENYVAVAAEKSVWKIGHAENGGVTWLDSTYQAISAPAFVEVNQQLLVIGQTTTSLDIFSVDNLRTPLHSIPVYAKPECPPRALLSPAGELLVATCHRDLGVVVFSPFAKNTVRVGTVPELRYRRDFAWSFHEGRLLIAGVVDDSIQIFEPLTQQGSLARYPLSGSVHEHSLLWRTEKNGELQLQFLASGTQFLHVLKVFNRVE